MISQRLETTEPRERLMVSQVSVTSPLAPTSKWTIVSHVGRLGGGSGRHFTLLMVSKVAQLQSRTKIFIAVFVFIITEIAC